MLKLTVYASSRQPGIHTHDEQGRVVRSLPDLIRHAANRHAVRTGGRFYLGGDA